MKYVGKAALAALLAAVCMILCACGGDTVLLRSVSQERRREVPHAEKCAALTLPDTLHAPMTDGVVNTALEDGVLAGAFTSVSACSTGEFGARGSVTARMRALPEGEGAAADVECALWRQTESGAQYLATVAFACDGGTWTHTFDGLSADGRYRLVFSCAGQTPQRMTGAFTVQGVTAQFPGDEQEAAIAIDAPQEKEREESRDD